MTKPLTQTDSSGMYTEITGVILAGGKSTRMGTDKAFLMLDGQPFIKIIVEKFTKLFQTVFIVADERGKFAQVGLPIIHDIYKDCGPLGGIHSALYHSSTAHVFVAPCDTPLILTDVIQFLIESAQPNEITVGHADGFVHPLFGIYPASALTIIDQSLGEGKRKVLDILKKVPNSVINLTQWNNELSNINDPARYEQTLKHH